MGWFEHRSQFECHRYGYVRPDHLSMNYRRLPQHKPIVRLLRTLLIVIFAGATNRPQDLDKAILRRMPAQFHIGLPSEEQRKKILQLVLCTESVSDDVDFNRLSKLTNGFSGSDLRELCRHASVYRIRELMRRTNNLDSIGTSNGTNELEGPPAITMQDLISSFGKMRESKMHTGMLQPENRIELD